MVGRDGGEKGRSEYEEAGKGGVCGGVKGERRRRKLN